MTLDLVTKGSCFEAAGLGHLVYRILLSLINLVGGKKIKIKNKIISK